MEVVIHLVGSNRLCSCFKRSAKLQKNGVRREGKLLKFGGFSFREQIVKSIVGFIRVPIDIHTHRDKSFADTIVPEPVNPALVV